MRNGKNDRIHIADGIKADKFDAVQTLCFIRVGIGIGNYGSNTIFLQFVININDLGIPGIGALNDIVMYYQGDESSPWVPKEYDPKDR